MDDFNYSDYDDGLQPLCKCGEYMTLVSDNDEYATEGEFVWLCPRCDEDEIRLLS